MAKVIRGIVLVALVATVATVATASLAGHHVLAARTDATPTPSPLTFPNVPTGDIQAILDAHPNETVIINGTGYRPATPIPGSGSCAQPPAQSATFDRTQLSDAALAAYGLPPHPTGAGATASQIASWEAAVRASTHRVCTERALFDPQTGTGITARNTSMAYNTNFQAGNIDNEAAFSWVDANWYVPSVASSSNNVESAIWTGIGDFGQLQQGGSESDMGVWFNQHYFVWTEYYPGEYQQWAFDVNAGDPIFSEVYMPNCEYDEDLNSGQTVSVCSGPTATNSDADFIVERPQSYGLAKFGSVTISNTADSVGDPDGDSHFGVWMLDSNNNACASPGPWNSEAFTVTWYSYC